MISKKKKKTTQAHVSSMEEDLGGLVSCVVYRAAAGSGGPLYYGTRLDPPVDRGANRAIATQKSRSSESLSLWM